MKNLCWAELYNGTVRAWKQGHDEDSKKFAAALRADIAYRSAAFGYPKVLLYTGERIEGAEQWKRLAKDYPLQSVASAELCLDEIEEGILACF